MVRGKEKALAVGLAALFALTARGDVKSSLNLELGIRGERYPAELPEPLHATAAIVDLKAVGELRDRRAWRLRAEPRVRLAPLDASLSERYMYDVPVATAQVTARPFVFTAGMSTFTWGATDGFNPLDVLSPRNYFDPLRSEKLGVPSLAIKADLSSAVTLEAVYIPRSREAMLPGASSRWLPRDVIRNRSVSGGEAATIRLPEVLRYSYGERVVLDQALQHNAGARLLATPLPGLDLSLQAYEGVAPAPATTLALSGTVVALQPALVIQADPDIQITPVYYRQRTEGGSAVYVLGDFILRFEAAFTQVLSRHGGLPGNASEYVLGAERSFAIGEATLTVLAQVTRAARSESSDNSATSLNRIFDRAGMLGVRLAATSSLSFFGSALYDSLRSGSLWHLDASYRLSDALTLGLGLDALQGATGTPIGTYQRNDRVYAQLLGRW